MISVKGYGKYSQNEFFYIFLPVLFIYGPEDNNLGAGDSALRAYG